MPRIFVSRNHPCPECYGNTFWLARQCPHCGHRVSMSDRCNWSPEGAKILLFAAIVGVVVLLGLFPLRALQVMGVI